MTTGPQALATPAKPRPSGGLARRLALVVTVVGLVLIGGYALVGVVVDWSARRIPDSFERDWFGELGGEQEGWRLEARDKKERQARRLFQRLCQSAHLRTLAYELYFIDDDEPNAFALAGGAVGVTRGLLELVGGQTGLAMVIAHELGHLQHRHPLRQMGRSLFVMGLLSLFFGEHEVLIDLVVDVAGMAHSRESEFEADAYGLRAVHQVFGTTKGALEFYEKLEKNSDADDSRLMSFLSTHPYTPDRIQRLRQLQRQLRAKAIAR